MPKFDMFESRKEIRLDSSRVKRKLLVIKTSNQQRKIETRLDLPAVGFEKTSPPHEAVEGAEPSSRGLLTRVLPPSHARGEETRNLPPLRGLNEQLLASEACFVPSSLSPHAGDKECSNP